MTIEIFKNILLKGMHQKPIILDAFIPKGNKPKHTVIYCHGFKGFKDWGANDELAKFFAESGVNFIKFNFSHNGGTPEHPIDFPDLEAFGNNNFTKELDDLNSVLNWIDHQNEFESLTINQQITVMAHSRGSGTAIIKASEDSRINKLISVAGISDFKARFIDDKTLEYWKKNGVIYIENSRTKQQMPLYYQIAEDISNNPERLSIENATKKLNKPHLIVHGTEDPTVNIEEAKAVHGWSKNSKLEIVEGADHVFNVKHPWNKHQLPEEFKKLQHLCLKFITNQ